MFFKAGWEKPWNEFACRVTVFYFYFIFLSVFLEPSSKWNRFEKAVNGIFPTWRISHTLVDPRISLHIWSVLPKPRMRAGRSPSARSILPKMRCCTLDSPKRIFIFAESNCCFQSRWNTGLFFCVFHHFLAEEAPSNRLARWLCACVRVVRATGAVSL